jgi:hypothetical protein
MICFVQDTNYHSGVNASCLGAVEHFGNLFERDAGPIGVKAIRARWYRKCRQDYCEQL